MFVTFQLICIKICALLAYYLACNCNFLPTFRDNVSLLSSRVKKSKKSYVLGFNTLEDISVRLSRNVDNEIRPFGPQYLRIALIALTSYRKLEITYFISLSIVIPFIVRKYNCCSIFTCIVVLKRGAYVPVRVQLRTWLKILHHVLNAVAFVCSEN
jgi:hypothetical protein